MTKIFETDPGRIEGFGDIDGMGDIITRETSI